MQIGSDVNMVWATVPLKLVHAYKPYENIYIIEPTYEDIISQERRMCFAGSFGHWNIYLESLKKLVKHLPEFPELLLDWCHGNEHPAQLLLEEWLAKNFKLGGK